MLREATYPLAAVNVLDVSSQSMAAFQVFLYGRFWVFTEASIQRHGPLSTEALLDTWDIKGEERQQILSSRRALMKVIRHSRLGDASIRDQKPMSDGQLARCLQNGLTTKDWYRTLNGKVFFWLTKDRLRTLMKCYADYPNLVSTVDTAELLKRYIRRTHLSPLNSGCTRPMPHPRGKDTFQTLAKYDFEETVGRRAERQKQLSKSSLNMP
jgi:hypothetical protein